MIERGLSLPLLGGGVQDKRNIAHGSIQVNYEVVKPLPSNGCSSRLVVIMTQV